MSLLLHLDGGNVYADGDALCWLAGLAIDADGAPDAYHPKGTPGRDRLGNAGRPGRWVGIVTDTGFPSGEPVVQGKDDPAPGFFISPTALVDRRYGERNPRRYVDAATVPYIAIPRDLLAHGARPGDLGVALVLASSALSACIVADVGPRGRIGEGSIALAEALGLPSDPRAGGVESGVACVVFPHSSKGWPRDFAPEALARFAGWGGVARLVAATATS